MCYRHRQSSPTNTLNQLCFAVTRQPTSPGRRDAPFAVTISMDGHCLTSPIAHQQHNVNSVPTANAVTSQYRSDVTIGPKSLQLSRAWVGRRSDACDGAVARPVSKTRLAWLTGYGGGTGLRGGRAATASLIRQAQ